MCAPSESCNLLFIDRSLSTRAGNPEEASRRRGGAGRRARAAAPRGARASLGLRVPAALPARSPPRRARPGEVVAGAAASPLLTCSPGTIATFSPRTPPRPSNPTPPCSSSSSAGSQRSPPNVTGARTEAATAARVAQLAQLASHYRWSGVDVPAAQPEMTPTGSLCVPPPRTPTLCWAPLPAGTVPSLCCQEHRCGAVVRGDPRPPRRGRGHGNHRGF